MFSRNRKFALAVAATMALGLTACSGEAAAPPPEAEPDGLVAAAVAEGAVTLYSSVEETATAAFADAFTEKYGIQVNVIRLTSSKLAQRFSAEAQAGAPAADVIIISRTGFTAEAIKEGWLVPLADAELPDFPGELGEGFLLPDEGTAVTIIQTAGIAYNTDLVSGSDVPEKWEDLLDPKWQGKIAIPDPASSASYIGEWLSVAAESDPGFLEAFGAQGLKKYESGVPAASAVAAGEVAFNVMGLPSHIEELKAAGAPIEFAVPELTSGAEVVVGIATAAKSPSAARLLAQYVLSAEGSMTLAEAAGAVSPFDAESLPARYVSPDLASVAAKQDEVMRKLGLN